jgi:hypothetical protein
MMPRRIASTEGISSSEEPPAKLTSNPKVRTPEPVTVARLENEAWLMI